MANPDNRCWSIHTMTRTTPTCMLTSEEKLPDAKLKEFVGHTPLQVIAGILLGIVNAVLLYSCVF